MTTFSKEAHAMRGDDQQQGAMYSYLSPEARVPQDHPLRAIRAMVDQVLAELSPEFDRLYARTGRPSIAPEKLLRALLLQVLYTVRSERLLMDNRHGLAVATRVTPASGTAEWEAAHQMVRPLARGRRLTLGGDKAFDTREFVERLRARGVTPHVAQNTTHRRSAIDGRTTRHGGYAVSQQKRKRIEEIFGWLKTVALMRKTRHRGRRRVGWMFTFTAAVYNLVRIRNLVETTG